MKAAQARMDLVRGVADGFVTLHQIFVGVTNDRIIWT
ncbi:MAG: hypothetical protein QOJ39_986 [Candidatus Eremiobacteraeota bacterium]|jgi:hypothetical protein|nr:hypothetical protein [Candidatus Eremiobacteraeota bacterium]